MSRSNASDLAGKVAVVTGASSGLGRVTATALAARGAHVVLATRNANKTERVMEGIRREHPTASLEHATVDLDSLEYVRAGAAEIVERHDRLDVLVNNAGIMGGPEARTADGFESHMGTNHLAHFALAGRLLPLLMATPASRVVVVSSNMHKMGRLDRGDLMWERRRYWRWGAYAQSKLANLLFMRELNGRFAAAGSSSFAVAAHPGVTKTESHRPARGRVRRALGEAMSRTVLAATSQPLEDAARSQLHAATSDVPPGSYWGPSGALDLRGAPGEAMPSHRARNDSDARWLWNRSIELTGVDFSHLRDRG